MTTVALFGSPGAGKGVAARALSKRLGAPHIATGDILRAAVQEDSELGRLVRGHLERGELVPDEVVNEIVRQRLSESDAQKGWILDGYPRTLAQARALEAMLAGKGRPLELAVELKVSEELVMRRLRGRLVCSQCGAIYHVESMPPRRAGRCDECGAELVQREDEGPEVVKHRFAVYRQETAPVLSHYRRQGLLHEVEAEEGVEKVVAAVLALLGTRGEAPAAVHAGEPGGRRSPRRGDNR